MADGENTLKLEVTISDLALRHLRERAEKLGMTLDAAAAEVIEQQLFDYDDYDWGDDPANDPRSGLSEDFDPNEPTISAEEALARFRAVLEKRLAAKA